MARMKTFGIYLLIVVAFFIFSNVMINIALKVTYVNGIVQGKLKNNTNEDIINKYIKIDMYTSRNNILGSKYIHIQNLKVGQEQEFKIGFQLTNADKCNISIVETGEVDTTDKVLFTSEELGTWAIMKLIVLMMIPV